MCVIIENTEKYYKLIKKKKGRCYIPGSDGTFNTEIKYPAE